MCSINSATEPSSESATLRLDPATPATERTDRTPLETLVLRRLDDEKAQDIIFIDLKDKSSVADGLVIASGRSHRHVGAIADHLLRALKEGGHGKAKVEGLPACDWVLIDAGDLVVHLFRPEVRNFYNIEKIWSVEPPTLAAAHSETRNSLLFEDYDPLRRQAGRRAGGASGLGLGGASEPVRPSAHGLGPVDIVEVEAQESQESPRRARPFWRVWTDAHVIACDEHGERRNARVNLPNGSVA